MNASAALMSRDDLKPQDWFDRINPMFHLPTRAPWCDRVARPATFSDPRTGKKSQASLARYWTPRDQYLDTLWSYKTGDAPLPHLKEEYQEVFRDVIRKSRSNYAPMCIAAMLDRLELQDVSTLSDDDTDGDDLAAEIMDETGFVAVSKDWFAQGLSMGESYAMVVPGVEGGEVLATGKPAPTIHAIDPRRCIGIPDLNNPVRLCAAVVHQYDPILQLHTAFLYLPGWKWTLLWNADGRTWDLAEGDAERIEGLDALGGIPIVRFENLDGLGEYEPHIDLLDRINDVTLQRIIGFWYQALRQRVLSGDEDAEDEDSPESQTAPDRDKNKVFKAGPGEVWQIPADFKFTELQQADFGPLLNGKRDDVKEFAAVTSTPLHLITPDAANGSAQGAGLLREALTAKVRDRRARFTPPLKLLWRMVFAMAGAEDRGRKMRLHWGPIEFHTLAEMGSASAQAQGTLSTEDRCERIWDLSPDETKRNLTRLTTDRLMGFSTTQGGAQSPPPTDGAGGAPVAPPAPAPDVNAA